LTAADLGSVPAVLIPVVTQHYTMLARNLPYTGVTRGKRLMWIWSGRRKLSG
jgi:exodeoxyribonuclease V alpha subunit